MLAMSTFVSPQIFLVSLLAGWLNQEQQKILEYLQEENRVLKAQLGQRLRLSDEQRRRLAAKGKELGPETPRGSGNSGHLCLLFIHPPAHGCRKSSPCGAKYPGFCADSKAADLWAISKGRVLAQDEVTVEDIEKIGI